MDFIKRTWQNIVNFAPWKAVFLTWLIQMVVLFVFYMALFLAFGWQVPGILRFLINVVTFVFIYMKVYPRVYPNGWTGGFWR